MTVTFFGHKNTPDSIQPIRFFKAPLKFAVSKRNGIMLKLADAVVMYACMPDNTWNLKALAEDRGKKIINSYNADRKLKTGAEIFRSQMLA